MRLRPASTWQSKDAPLRRLALQARPGIRRDLKAALQHLGDSVDVDRATDLLRHGLTGRVYEAVSLKHFGEILKTPFARLGELHTAAAEYGAGRVNASFRRAGARLIYKDPRNRVASSFVYDRFSPATQETIRLYQDAFIRELSTEARNTIDATVLAGLRSGMEPREIIEDVRSVIGLTDRQARAVQNYRRMLYDLNPEALTRQLSNTSDDARLQAARDSGVRLTDDAVDEMVANYESNYLDYRARTIAETESVRAANSGIHDSYEQAIDRGALPEAAVRRHWRVDLTEATCPVCLSIPDMNPDGVGVGEDFQSIDGPMGDPPDPHPRCACSVDFVTDLDALPQETFEAA